MSFAKNRGLIDSNPCERGERLYQADRTDSYWKDADFDALLSAAPEPIRLAVILALWTGQRQGDLLRLPWSAYDGKHIRLVQSKTGRHPIIPVGEPLRVVLDRTPRRGPAAQLARPAVDVGRLSYVVGKGLCEGQHREPDIS